MSELVRATWILFQAHLVRVCSSWRALVAAGLGLLPVGASLIIAVACRIKGPPPISVVLHMGWFLEVQLIVPLIALTVGSAVIAEEIEDRTITYLFTRPIPRASILLGRWLAALVVVLLVVGGSSASVLHLLADVGTREGAGVELPADFQSRLFQCALLGGAVYSAVFAAAGALFKRSVLIGLGYTFVFEQFLGALPGANQKLTILYYLKSYLLAGDPELLSNFRETLAPVELAEPGAALRTLFMILVGALLLGAWRFTRREYVLAA